MPFGGFTLDGSSQFVGVHHILLNFPRHQHSTSSRLDLCPLEDLCYSTGLAPRFPDLAALLQTSHFLLLPSTGLAPNRFRRLPAQTPRSGRPPPDLSCLVLAQHRISS